MQKVKEEYKKAEKGTHSIIEISSTSEAIDLKIPEDGVEVAGGWCLLPLSHPQVSVLFYDMSD